MILSKSTGIQVKLSERKVCDIKDIIVRFPGVECEENIPANTLTSFCIGGQVKYLITLNDEQTVSEVIKEIKKTNLEILPLGAGTNMLVSDEGFPGVFIRLGENFRKIERISDTKIKIGASVKINDLIDYLRKNRLGCLAFLSGIPGTIGGAIAMNAGAFGDEIKNHVLKVNAVRSDGQTVSLDASECKFEYRNSLFKTGDYFVLSTELNVVPDKDIADEIDQCINHRSVKHTPGGRYAGSVFKNPPGDYAGKLLDEAGMKGLRVGTAYVFEKHANFIMADADAKASDVLELMQIAALRVYYLCGVKLYPEIELVGFNINWDDIFDI